MIAAGLESSRFYRIRYAARNIIFDAENLFECDQLQFSEPIVVHTAVEPTTPQDLQHNIDLRYRDKLVYTFKAPYSDGGSKLEQYHLELRLAGSADVEVSVSITVQASDYKFEDLVPATDYECRIKVNNLVGESDWSDWVPATTGIEPTRPGILSFDATTRTTISLSWTQIVGAETGGSELNEVEITYYHLMIDDGLGGDFRLHSSIPGTDSQ